MNRTNATLKKIGRTPVVVLPLDEYDRMREDLAMLRSAKLTAGVAKARQEAVDGEVLSVDEVKKNLDLM